MGGWRSILLRLDLYRNKSMCDIPDRIRPFAEALCLSVLRKPCEQLPCIAVYHSSEMNIPVEHLENGPTINSNKESNRTNSGKVQRIECIRSPALELLMYGPPYPSLRTDGHSRITKELLGEVLSQSYRSPESIWGLSLNSESISYYP